MTVKSLLILAIIGLVAGFLAGLIWKGRGFGLVGNLIIGILGAILGGWLFGILGIGGGLIVQIIAALVGALIILWIISRLK
ncbi:MAG: GlsB/YeaQ/YmgE family stress response membrane protein [Leptospirales bacterium]|nr:GlsB/YeaQ/YmgE family stress response membrane protein [Leptospirales bacterium]